MACAGARLAAVEDADRRTARGEPPGDAKPDHARADDGNARLFDVMGKLVRQRRLPSLVPLVIDITCKFINYQILPTRLPQIRFRQVHALNIDGPAPFCSAALVPRCPAAASF